MQISIVNGIYTDNGPDFRTSYPRNYVPVPKSNGISAGYLRPADGVVSVGTGPGVVRGGCKWGDHLYRVMGTKLVRVSSSGGVTELGDVGSGGWCTFDYGFDRLAITSGGRLYYFDGATLSQVTDPDLGAAIDVVWIGGYFLTTDGENLVTTDLNDPASVGVLSYGSAESDPDQIKAVDKLYNEAYALGRYTIEVFQNVGGTGFPFSRNESAQVGKGIVGTHAYCKFSDHQQGDTFAFVGGAKGDPCAVWIMAPGSAFKISTAEIDKILAGFTESQLSETVVEYRADNNHQHILIHLPDRCMVYDISATREMQTPIWFELGSSVVWHSEYRAKGLVWCYDRWNVCDTQSGSIGILDDEISSHWGQAIGWDFGVSILYNEGNDGIIHEMELSCLTGRVPLGIDPVIWTSHSKDGQTWSMERPMKAGKQGNRSARVCWRSMGRIGHWRIQRFRGTSDAHVSIARLDAQIEPLTRGYSG